jgi:hypothetical protein
MSDQAIAQAAQAVSTNLAAISSALQKAFIGQASTGTFTMSATASKAVADSNVKTTSQVFLFAQNAAAGTLMGSAKSLYTTTANGSFTALTASGASAAGTEIFSYLVLNLA